MQHEFALPIALARDHGAAASFATQMASSQRQIDQRRAVLNTLGLMFQTARVHGDRTISPRKHAPNCFSSSSSRVYGSAHFPRYPVQW